MTISEFEKQLVRETFQQVGSLGDEVARLFYGRLFVVAPHVKPMFAHLDMNEQGRKLLMMLSVAVNKLNDLESLALVLEDLGRRHVKYGVQEEHYAIVGDVLLWTLEQGLQDAFTPEVKQAWVNVYTLVSSVAIQGARGVVSEVA